MIVCIKIVVKVIEDDFCYEIVCIKIVVKVIEDVIEDDVCIWL